MEHASKRSVALQTQVRLRSTILRTYTYDNLFCPDSTAGGGTGFVSNVTFQDFTGRLYSVPFLYLLADEKLVPLVSNVDNPIVIDQVRLLALTGKSEVANAVHATVL